MTIPIAKPFLGKEEALAASRAILSGWVTQGPRVEEFEDAFASYVGSKYACAVSSCTTALHIALLTVGVKPGDVVITVSHSFIATANSVRYCDAEPVFVDIDPYTFNMSAQSLEKCLTKDCVSRGGKLYYKSVSKLVSKESPLTYLSNSKAMGRVAAIIPVHQMGMPCSLDVILSLARKFNIPVVEDAACAIGSEMMISGRREMVGSPRGDIACFSFHPRKVVTTGDGGMLVTANARYDRRFRLLRQHGMNVSDRVRHSAKKLTLETYQCTAFNYRMTDIQAAVGIEQLKKAAKMIRRRRRLASVYKEELSGIEWLRLPVEPNYCKSNWQSYPVTILDNSPRSRDRLMQYLLDNGVSTRRGIMNAHEEPPYRGHGEDLKFSEKAKRHTILLPLFHELRKADIKKIARLIKHA
ncbi:MAG: DegT/DnrJ/EryC1/StrS family aminotransferase [Candidatus Omnitrophota bacterium]|nr:DegT/DnrJ/EryC1/StrS family aminotransferase [Candidatus Omnitrophota bacterium]